MSDEVKKEATKKLAELVKLAQDTLVEAKRLADEHGLAFRFDVGAGDKEDRGWGARYVPTEKFGEPGTDDYEEYQGHWYWQNSSMNC